MPFDGLIPATKWGSPRVSQRAIEEFGLIAVVACNEMTGGIVREMITGAALVAAGGADWGGSGGLVGARANAANAAYRLTLPGEMKRLYPLSLFSRLSVTAAPSANAQFFGLNPNNAASAPFVCASLGVDSNGFLESAGDDGAGNFTNCSSAVKPSAGVAFDLAAAIYPGTTGFKLYLNGALTATGFTVGTTNGSGPSYTSTAQITVGEAWSSTDRNPACVIDIGMIAAQAWTAEQIAALHADPYRIFDDPLARLYFDAYPAASGGTTYNVSTSDGVVLGSTPTQTMALVGALDAGVVLAQTAAGVVTFNAATAQGLVLAAADAVTVTFNATTAQGVVLDAPVANTTDAFDGTSDGVALGYRGDGGFDVAADFTAGLTLADAYTGGFSLDGAVSLGLSLSSAAGLDFVIGAAVAAGIGLTDAYAAAADLAGAVQAGALLGVSASTLAVLQAAVSAALVANLTVVGSIAGTYSGPVVVTLSATAVTGTELTATAVTNVTLTVKP